MYLHVLPRKSKDLQLFDGCGNVNVPKILFCRNCNYIRKKFFAG